jgi:hypothetical protein
LSISSNAIDLAFPVSDSTCIAGENKKKRIRITRQFATHLHAKSASQHGVI